MREDREERDEEMRMTNFSKEMRGELFIGKTILAKISPQNAIKINEKEK
jgi:hypothetical protein